MLTAGSKAKPFTLRALDGSAHSLDELLNNGPVLLAIFKISCPVCQLTLPFLERIAPGSLTVAAISQDDAASTRRFQSRFGVSLLTLLDSEDEGYPVSNAFGITHVPALFRIEPGRAISLAVEGFVKADLESLGVAFRADEAVPAWKAG